ncbi:hypothetical protein DSO57_1031510 [Entomophthora muscae]|uniref:Uncharacterized protein n=1 Tax=Entomophthora muscae TaxID=34485 RepID=A0ACC2UB15_9FUNG|nr:hypothetical protein DSO57_1031510 [Entomophthora muscae]
MSGSCEKWNGDISIYLPHTVHYSQKSMLKEVVGELYIDNVIPSNLKMPLKVSRLSLESNAKSRNNDFSQIKADEFKLLGFKAKELIIAEPSVFKWDHGSIKTIAGITGTRLKHVELSSKAKDRVKFDNVTRLDSLIFHEELTPTFPNLTHVNEVYAKDLMGDLTMDIQSVGKLDITTSDDSGGRSILLNNLKTADEVTISPHKVKLFSAPKLTWGRLEIKHVTELNLNINLAWKGVASITSDDFCEKYYTPFTARGLAFKTDNHCTFDCNQPYTPMSLTYYASCKEFKTIEINQNSAENILLQEAATIAGDLIITNYNGTFSAPKLTAITGNVIITNSKNYHFSALNLRKIQGSIIIQKSSSFVSNDLNHIQGSVTIRSFSSFSADRLDEIKGNVTIHNSSSFKESLLKKIKGDLMILDSSSLFANRLYEIQGNVLILNTSLSASTLKEVGGSISIRNSNAIYFPMLKQIKGNLNVTNSNAFHFPVLKQIKGNLNVTNSNNPYQHIFDQLERVKSIGFHQQTKNLEFRSLKAINTLRIHNSSLTSLTGIDVTQLEELTIEDCPQLNNLPLYYLKKISSASISSVGFKDISQIFYTSFDVSNSLTIKDFQHSQIYLPLISADKLTLKDNTNLEALHLEATHLTTPLKIINNPSLYVVGFHNMKITYKLKNSNFKGNHFFNISDILVFASSSAKEFQSQGIPDTGN